MQLPANPKGQVYEVIDRVLEGMALRDAVQSTGLTVQTFAYRLQSDKAAAVAYARAAEIRADLLADEVIHIADGDADPAKARNQIQARQWLAGKLHQKKYGDRIDLNVTQTLDIGSTLAEARARLLPVCDQYNVIDAQVIDSQGQNQAKPRDNESLIPQIDATPDIFS